MVYVKEGDLREILTFKVLLLNSVKLDYQTLAALIFEIICSNKNLAPSMGSCLERRISAH